MNFKQPLAKKVILSSLICSLFMMNYSGFTAFAQVSKTPYIGSNAQIMQPIEPFKMPDDYPKDLSQWYKDNMDARSYVVMDQETNKILAEKEGTTPYPIASMSKVIAIYLVYKAIDEGKLSMDSEITIPQEIADNISANPDLSNAGLVAGEKYTVKDLIYGVMLLSGNDATSALMWEIYGNEELAVNAIKEQLAQWGITNIQFYQTSGAPNEELPESMWVPGSSATSENYMSAADVALMAKHVIEDYPQILEVTSTEQYVFKEGTELETVITNPNQLLPGGEYGREGITGLKSGYTDAAGRNFVATSTENGRKVIAVAMGTFGEGMSSYWEIEILLDALLDYPDLYKSDKLPVYDTNSLKELLAQKEKEQAAKTEEKQEKTFKDYENKRENPLTNFIKNIFSVFN